MIGVVEDCVAAALIVKVNALRMLATTVPVGMPEPCSGMPTYNKFVVLPVTVLEFKVRVPATCVVDVPVHWACVACAERSTMSTARDRISRAWVDMGEGSGLNELSHSVNAEHIGMSEVSCRDRWGKELCVLLRVPIPHCPTHP